MRFRKEIGNSCLTLEIVQAIVLGKMLGILKPIPLCPKFMFVGHCFLALGKLLVPH